MRFKALLRRQNYVRRVNYRCLSLISDLRFFVSFCQISIEYSPTVIASVALSLSYYLCSNKTQDTVSQEDLTHAISRVQRSL